MADDDRIVLEARLTSIETKLDGYIASVQELNEKRIEDLEKRVMTLEKRFLMLMAAVAFGGPAMSAGLMKFLGVAPEVAAALPTP